MQLYNFLGEQVGALNSDFGHACQFFLPSHSFD